MVFYEISLTRRIAVHPKNFSSKIKDFICNMVYAKFQGVFDTQAGYIILVNTVDVNSIKHLPLMNLNGLAEFNVTFTAIVQYPLVGEVIDVIVRKVHSTCVVINYLDFIDGMIKYENFAEDDDYVSVTKEDGEIIFESMNDKEATAKGIKTDAKKIKAGTFLKMRIIHRTFGSNGFFLGGSLRGKYLGIIEEEEDESEVLQTDDNKANVNNIKVEEKSSEIK